MSNGAAPPSPPPEPAQTDAPAGSGLRNLLLPWLLVGVFAAIAAMLLILLLTRPTGADPEQSATAPTASGPTTAAPSAQPSSTPDVALPTIDFGPVPDAVDCTAAEDTVPLQLSWSTTDATQAWIGVGTSNAQAEPFESVPTSATDYDGIGFRCADERQSYTLTAVGPGGIVHHTFEIVRR